MGACLGKAARLQGSTGEPYPQCCLKMPHLCRPYKNHRQVRGQCMDHGISLPGFAQGEPQLSGTKGHWCWAHLGRGGTGSWSNSPFFTSSHPAHLPHTLA